MMLQVLFEDNHLLAVNKPAGLPTMGAVAGEHCLVEVVKNYIREKYQKPGNVYLGIVSRLDEPVSGVLLFARNSKATSRLARQFREREAEKTYWAIVSGHPRPQRAELVDWLVKNHLDRKSDIATAGTDGAQEARLVYQVLHEYAEHSLLQVQLKTGRKHQIRAQLSSRGHFIVGDRKYGSNDSFAAGIALHARRLVVVHPKSFAPFEITAPLPESWETWFSPDREGQF